MGVGAANPEGADTGSPRKSVGAPPGCQFGGDVKGAFVKVDPRVGAAEVEAGRDLSVTQAEDRLQKSRDSRCCVQVSHVGLHRSDGARSGGTSGMNSGERGDFDRIPQRRPGPVRLDVTDAFRRHGGRRQGRLDNVRLTVLAWRSVADLLGAIVVDRAALHHRENRVAIGHGVVERLQQDGAGTTAAHHPVCVGIEGAAVPVGGEDHALPMEIPPDLREAERYAAGESHVATAFCDRLAGDGDGNQRCGTGGLHIETGSAEIQLVGNSRGEVVLVAGEKELEPIDRFNQILIGVNVVEDVAVGPAAGENADATGVPPRIAAGTLKGLP